MARSLKSAARPGAPAPPSGQGDALPQAPLGGTRAEALRRLQMGAIGVVAVLILIGLASIIRDRAAQTDTTTVAGAAPTSTPNASPSAADPLAEAGMVPDIPASSAAASAGTPTLAPGTAPTTAPGAR